MSSPKRNLCSLPSQGTMARRNDRSQGCASSPFRVGWPTQWAISERKGNRVEAAELLPGRTTGARSATLRRNCVRNLYTNFGQPRLTPVTSSPSGTGIISQPFHLLLVQEQHANASLEMSPTGRVEAGPVREGVVIRVAASREVRPVPLHRREDRAVDIAVPRRWPPRRKPDAAPERSEDMEEIGAVCASDLFSSRSRARKLVLIHRLTGLRVPQGLLQRAATEGPVGRPLLGGRAIDRIGAPQLSVRGAIDGDRAVGQGPIGVA